MILSLIMKKIPYYSLGIIKILNTKNNVSLSIYQSIPVFVNVNYIWIYV